MRLRIITKTYAKLYRSSRLQLTGHTPQFICSSQKVSIDNIMDVSKTIQCVYCNNVSTGKCQAADLWIVSRFEMQMLTWTKFSTLTMTPKLYLTLTQTPFYL